MSRAWYVYLHCVIWLSGLDIAVLMNFGAVVIEFDRSGQQ